MFVPSPLLVKIMASCRIFRGGLVYLVGGRRERYELVMLSKINFYYVSYMSNTS